MSDTYDVQEKNSKFIVIKNGEPLEIPFSDHTNMVTQFDTVEEAKKYIGIIQYLKRQKTYK